jgi:elongation factor P
MKISGNEVRVGNIIEYENSLWSVIKTQHTQPGKGGAYMQVEMKNIVSGMKKNERFRSAESVERVHLEEYPYQYLYKDGTNFVFMDQQNFDQILLSESFIGDAEPFLQDNMIVNVCMYNEKPISIKLPTSVVLEVTEAEPVVKGQTATSSYKPAILANGVKIQVPPHIEAGMRVVVNTADRTYVERSKD